MNLNQIRRTKIKLKKFMSPHVVIINNYQMRLMSFLTEINKMLLYLKKKLIKFIVMSNQAYTVAYRAIFFLFLPYIKFMTFIIFIIFTCIYIQTLFYINVENKIKSK